MECASFRIIFTTSILPEFEINVKKDKGLDFLFDYRNLIQSVRKLKLVHIKEGRILLIAGIKGKMVMRIFKRFAAFVSNLGLKTGMGKRIVYQTIKTYFEKLSDPNKYVQDEAFQYILSVTEKEVNWAYEVWVVLYKRR
ncbi:hypothetical protein AN964_22415 [Heyndrickxia shackletonii]|uniref:Uncharacterized protein n=2 Tax=Heyndrickxia shackletonii TaxID=157838 RepID=A0A0Q3WRJ0_9BACI|nr:hypothetical protein AN964_22415 [Heyndrickxia shackletonii]